MSFNRGDLRATNGDPGRDPRMRVVSVAHVALIPDLRRVYLAAWGYASELANFRRKALSTDGFVVPDQVAEVRTVEAGRRCSTAKGLRPPFTRRSRARRTRRTEGSV